MSKLDHKVFHPRHNIVVQASAGSGKTFLLTGRILNLLISGYEPDSILAITFTKKAKGEMLQRINTLLRQLAMADEAETETLFSLYNIKNNMENRIRARKLYESLLCSTRQLQIETFHSFCQALLSRFPLESELAPGFEIVDDNSLLLHQAWDALMLQVTEAPHSLLAHNLDRLFESCNGLYQAKSALLAFVEHRGDWWAYTQGQQHSDVAAWQWLRDRLDIDPEKDYGGDYLRLYGGALRRYIQLLALHDNKTNRQSMVDVETALQMASGAGAETTLKRINQALFTQKGTPRLKLDTAKARQVFGIQFDNMRQLHEQLCEQLQLTWERLDKQRLLALNRAWYMVGRRLLSIYERVKSQQRVLDFTDLEWKAYRLLHHAEQAQWVQYKLDQRIEHILVDEFQDTNPVQWRLLLPLLEEMAAGNKERTRSVFIVGDVKQSIYGFRRADPEIFAVAREWMQQHLHAGVLDSHRSWRSAPGIIAFVNTVFENQMHNYITHNAQARHLWSTIEVHPPFEYPDADNGVEPQAVSFRDPLRQPRPESANRDGISEGEFIAARIKKLLKDQYSVWDGNHARPVQLGDIMILTRRRTDVWAYERCLLKERIAFTRQGTGSLIQTLEVNDLFSLLQFLNLPDHNLALATVLKSPIFCWDDHRLNRLIRHDGNGWFEKLQAMAAKHRNAAEAYTRLSHWLKLSGQIPVHDLMDRIFQQADVLDRFEAAFPEHLKAQVRANLTRFLELALEINSGRYPSLGKFVHTLHQRAGGIMDDLQEADTDNRDRVRMMTIHAAKGLEAPVVFLADTNAADVPVRSLSPLVHWPAHADKPQLFALKHHRWRALESESTARQASQDRENLNLLYVALTRAKQVLIISGQGNRKKTRLPSWHARIMNRRPLPLGENSPELDANEPKTPQAPWIISDGQPPAIGPSGREPQFPELPLIQKSLTEPLQNLPVHREILPSRVNHHVYVKTGSDRFEARMRGTIIHRMLQWIAENDEDGTLARAKHEFGMISANNLRDHLREAINLIHLPQLAPYFDPARYLSAKNEIPLIHDNGNETIYGVIDRLVEQEDMITVIDYKSAPVRQQDMDEYIREITPQIEYYKQAAAALFSNRFKSRRVPVQALLVFTAGGHCVYL